MTAITSRANPAVKAMAKLVASTVERKREGLSVLEGPHLVAAFLDSGRALRSLIVSQSASSDAQVVKLITRAGDAVLTIVADGVFDSISTVKEPFGVMAAAPTPAGEAVPTDAALCLLLEDIQDPGNVGTLIRSAAAAGAGHVLLSGTCAFAWSPKVLRAGQGSHFALNIVEGVDLVAFLAAYKGKSVALAARGKQSLHAVDLTGPTAIAVGNEGAGLSKLVLAGANVRAHIPMPGRSESLNAGVAGSIALFEVVRQRIARTTAISHAIR
jgi:RNA methyltransferase, TrmH family